MSAVLVESMARDLSAVIFDFDGVLVESMDVKTQAFAKLYEPYGPDVVEQVVRHHLANGGVSRFEKFRHYHQHFLGRAIAPDEVDALSRDFSGIVEDAVVRAEPVAGALSVLDTLVGTTPMFVVSGTPEAELTRILVRRGWKHYFDTAHGSPEKKRTHFVRILTKNSYAPANVLAVGDAHADYDAAVYSGTRFLGRVHPDVENPFPDSVQVVTDLTQLAQALS